LTVINYVRELIAQKLDPLLICAKVLKAYVGSQCLRAGTDLGSAGH